MRVQLILTLASALATGKADVAPDAADKAFEIAKTASPWAPAVIVPRIEYLFRVNPDSDEIPQLLNQLKVNARLQHATWVMEAAYGAYVGDWGRVEVALKIGKGLPGASPSEISQYERLTAFLTENKP